MAVEIADLEVIFSNKILKLMSVRLFAVDIGVIFRVLSKQSWMVDKHRIVFGEEIIPASVYTGAWKFIDVFGAAMVSFCSA